MPINYSPVPKNYSPARPQMAGPANPKTGLIGGLSSSNPYANVSTRSGPAYAPPPAPRPTANITSNFSGGNQSAAPSVSNQQPQQQAQYNDINQQVEDFGAIIDRDYEVAIGGLNSQESELRGQADAASQAITAGAQPVRNAITDAQTSNLQGLTTQEQQVQTQSKNAVQQARDLFRETQQQNIAQLSGLGLSSSSVSEALAEKLGVETARRLAGVSNSTNELMNNIASERTRVQTFFKNKMAEVETNLQTQLAGVQQALISGINQINQARQIAAADKANRRQELLSRAQSAVVQLQTQAQQFAQSLQTWNAQKQTSLGEAQRFVSTAPDQTALQTSIANVQKIAGAGYQPIFNVNNKGEVAYQLKPKKDDENEIPTGASIFGIGQ